MSKHKTATPEDGRVPIRWEDDVAEHDYAAAHAYLSLKLTTAATDKVVTHLRKAKLTTRRANDILRASGLTAAPLDDPGVVKDLIKVIERKALSPVLVVGGGTRSDIADGFSGSRWCTGSTRTGGVPLKLTDVGRTPTQADHGGRERVARRASFRGSQRYSPHAG